MGPRLVQKTPCLQQIFIFFIYTVKDSEHNYLFFYFKIIMFKTINSDTGYFMKKVPSATERFFKNQVFTLYVI